MRPQRGRRTGRRWGWQLALFVVGALMVAAAGWSLWVYGQIEEFAHRDEAGSADVICVFGAAEYSGRPSPVLKGRLDHALELYRHGIAPMIMTLGGSAPGDFFSEGHVGALYLMANGVPERAIIAETDSRNTTDQAEHILTIARANGYHRIVLVSDPYHVFRIQAICRAMGLQVMTSPRRRLSTPTRMGDASQIVHEIVSYTLWRVRGEIG